MTREERIAIIESTLLAAAEEARGAGYVIVSDDFIVNQGSWYGCCALGAFELSKTPGPLPLLALDDDAAPSEWDGIEHGFDGIPYRSATGQNGVLVPRDFWELGQRLREQLQPVRAADLGAVS